MGSGAVGLTNVESTKSEHLLESACEHLIDRGGARSRYHPLLTAVLTVLDPEGDLIMGGTYTGYLRTVMSGIGTRMP